MKWQKRGVGLKRRSGGEESIHGYFVERMSDVLEYSWDLSVHHWQLIIYGLEKELDVI